MNTDQMTAKIASGQGFIAALDQSGGSTPKALRGYGVEDSEWSGDDEMFGAIHAMRSRVITAPSFGSGKVIGAILFERTMDGEVEGKSTADALKARGIVPFIKVDQGLADEADGAQLMKPLDKLPALLEKATGYGMFGTKMRSVIKSANPAGIAAVVAQQFEVGNLKQNRGAQFSNLACVGCKAVTNSKGWGYGCNLLWRKCGLHVKGNVGQKNETFPARGTTPRLSSRGSISHSPN